MPSNSNSSFISRAKTEPKLPESGNNNLWYEDRGTDAVLVFLHGIFSDSRSSWLREETPSVYWPDLVLRDRRFQRYSLYLAGYYTALDAGAFKVQHCADELFRALARPDGPGVPSVLDRKTLVFVCHSTGGIVARYLLESRASEFKEKTVGLVLIASPSFGSAWATKLSWLSELYNARLARQLEWGNDTLDDLDERFHRLIRERRIPHLLGVEAYENHFVFHRKFLPDRLVVVDKNSAGRYFPPAHLLARTDHFTSVKPDSERHPAHALLVDFCSDLEKYEEREGRNATSVNTAGRIPSQSRPDRIPPASSDPSPAEASQAGAAYAEPPPAPRVERPVLSAQAPAVSVPGKPDASPTPQRSRRQPLWLALPLAAALLVALAFAAFRTAQRPELPQPTPFAAEYSLQAMPRWSPDGEQIAYSADVDGVLQIFTRSLTSATDRRQLELLVDDN